jgi:hypothetical protein
MRAFIFVVACCLFLSAGWRNAVAASGRDATAKITFDIPSQPLATALFAYSQQSGAEVFVDHALVASRWSTVLRGAYDIEAALRALLLGSGLVPRRAAPNGFTLVSIATAEPPPDRTPGWSSDRAQVRFYAALQAAVRRTLCARAHTQPGPYRAALAVWIGSSGHIDRVHLLGSNVDGEIGRILLNKIHDISLSEPPPPGFVQPVVLVVLPRTPDITGDCRPMAELSR